MKFQVVQELNYLIFKITCNSNFKITREVQNYKTTIPYYKRMSKIHETGLCCNHYIEYVYECLAPTQTK